MLELGKITLDTQFSASSNKTARRQIVHVTQTHHMGQKIVQVTEPCNDLADAACKWSNRAPPLIWAARHSANLAVNYMAHWSARVGSARQRSLDIDGPGILDEGERMRGGTSARDSGLFLCLCSWPSSDVGPLLWEASPSVCAPSASILSARRVVGVQALA